jgi:thiol-disulfide isomerase/thioredoxin
MKRFALVALMGLTLTGCGQTEKAALPPGLQDKPVQDGQWLLVNYWAVWCQPCRVEIPELNAFADEQEGRVRVYGVNYDNVDTETLLVQAAELGIEFTVLTTDPANTLGYARPMVLPTTMVINPEGEIMARLLGPQTVDSLVAALTAEKQELPPTLR